MGMIVYDVICKSFRELDITNFNDDIVFGTIFLQREALIEIKRYFSICGYFFTSRQDRCVYPIDIQKNKIVLYEWTYNSMPDDLKNALIKYNISFLPDKKIWSSFFIDWQFNCDMNVFEKYGGFIKLCSSILNSKERFEVF